MEEPKILIVDDSQLMIAILTDYLSSDYDIISATSGESALEKVKDESPDLILLDVILPKISGIEVCEILKSDEKNTKYTNHNGYHSVPAKRQDRSHRSWG